MSDPLPTGISPSLPALPLGSATGRDERLDLLRGLCVVGMLFGHLGWRHFAVHVRVGFVGVAEGFFLLSGATLGVIAARRRDASGERAFDRRLLRRAAWLFGVNLLGVAVYKLLTGPLFPPREIERLWRDTPPIWRWLSFDQPSVLNVLPRYALFLLLAPLALAGLRRGRQFGVAAGALALWASNLLVSGALTLPGFESTRASYPSASWQLLFFGGMVAGHALTTRWQRRLPGLVALAATALVAACVVAAELADYDALGAAISRPLLGPLRMVNLVAVAIASWWLVDRLRRSIAQATGWLLLPYGRNALPAFVLHIPLVWALLAVPVVASNDDLRKPVAAAFVLALLPVIRLPVVRRWLAP
ncbi:MAG: hypothetical protein AMXMBFR36_22760 [Acidobacteriota bacterium]